MVSEVLSQLENTRLALVSKIEPEYKSANGQFLTPLSIATAMADMFETPGQKHIRLLDPGAGTGVLTFSFIEMVLKRNVFPDSFNIVAFEKDKLLAKTLRKNISLATDIYKNKGLDIDIDIIEEDFIETGSELIKPKLRSSYSGFEPFTHVIMNPPYLKISASSKERQLLEDFGLLVNNLYSAFVGLSIKLLCNDGHLVAITPRSFCNGPYFLPFRKFLINQCSLRKIHLFNSRDNAFSEDDVLQENVIYYLQKNKKRNTVKISVSNGRSFQDFKTREVQHSEIVSIREQDHIIRIPANEFDDYVLERMSVLPNTLRELGIEVSTGPIVDFRLKESILETLQDNCVPLIYPSHFKDQHVIWPNSNGNKSNAIELNDFTTKWLYPNKHYVLIKRFSSKEERRRIYPAMFFPIKDFHFIGFENHLNLLHTSKSGITCGLAKGLTAYLSSTIVDLFFRQFSGHTQVNASDLRTFPFPDIAVIIDLSKFFINGVVLKMKVDKYLEKLFTTRYSISSPNPIPVSKHKDRIAQ
jgi:adenine-specific DNA-methyltransferase